MAAAVKIYQFSMHKRGVREHAQSGFIAVFLGLKWVGGAFLRVNSQDPYYKHILYI